MLAVKAPKLNLQNLTSQEAKWAAASRFELVTSVAAPGPRSLAAAAASKRAVSRR